jgi:cobalt transporter subunit CbtA
MAELRRIAWLALIAGALAGAVTTVAQLFTTVPLILAAETYEHAGAPDPAGAHAHGGDSHPHSAALARSAATLLFNVLAGIGFGLILSALLSSQKQVGIRQGLALGGAAFLAVTLAPALGLPPELPGTASAALSERQFWWIGTAVASSIGLALLVLGRGLWPKLAGIALLLLPHVVGAPHVDGVATGGPPEALQHSFIAASLGTTALFWLVLGAALGWLHRFAARRAAPPQP